MVLDLQRWEVEEGVEERREMEGVEEGVVEVKDNVLVCL